MGKPTNGWGGWLNLGEWMNKPNRPAGKPVSGPPTKPNKPSKPSGEDRPYQPYRPIGMPARSGNSDGRGVLKMAKNVMAGMAEKPNRPMQKQAPKKPLKKLKKKLNDKKKSQKKNQNKKQKQRG